MLILSMLMAVAAVPERVVVDTHLHVTMSHAATPFFRGEPGQGLETWSPGARLTNQVEADQLINSGTRLALAAMWVPLPLRPGRDALGETLNQLKLLRAFEKRRPAFAVVTTPAEARRALKLGRIALIPAIEGGEGITHVDDVDRLYAAGARAVTIVHFVDNSIGGASAGQFAYNFLGEKNAHDSDHGLSELGVEVVKRMLELGMMVDLAHASDKTSEEVLALAEERGVPVINTHGGSRALLKIERNISDELAARIARGGGTVGVTIFDHMVTGVPADQQWEGYVPGTCDDVIAHWRHLAAVAGAGQLTLGTDFNGFITRPHPGGSCPHGVRNAADLNELYDALVAHGVPAESLDGMGESFLHTWDVLDAKSSAAARAQANEADPYATGVFDVAL